MVQYASIGLAAHDMILQGNYSQCSKAAYLWGWGLAQTRGGAEGLQAGPGPALQAIHSSSGHFDRYLPQYIVKCKPYTHGVGANPLVFHA